MAAGREQAVILGGRLATEFNVELGAEPVAVSMMRRTQETAIAAGFRRLTIYPELNEEKGGLSDADIAIALRAKCPPQATRIAARLLIERPPQEKVWVTHALLIATLCQELGVYGDERFTPRFCEVRELPIPL